MAVYAQLGERGWSPGEVRGMDCYVAAGFLGHGPPGDRERYRAVLRGSRGVVHKDDDKPDPAADLLTKGDPHAATRAAALAADGDRPVVAMRPVKPADR